MPKVRKLPYYQMVSSAIPFTGQKWKGYMGSEGCVPLDTQKTVSMDRLAPGEPAPPKPTPEQRKAQQAEETHRKWLAQQAKKQPPPQDKPQGKPPVPDAEECENPPVFDMMDIPDAMEKMKWPVSAKIARKWFYGPKHIFDGDAKSVQPIDDTTVTLDWALKFGSVKKKFHALLAENIYSEESVKQAKKYLHKKIYETFVTQNASVLSFNTTGFLGDLRQFHLDWQFQLVNILALDTKDGEALTDLTASLANFSIYAAIGNALVYGDKYFKYDSAADTKTYCLDPKVQITHVYVYIKDNYSFNDKGAFTSQYLGHWNKSGLIVTKGTYISQLFGANVRSASGNTPELKDNHSDYLIDKGLDKPVDARRAVFKKFREQDVYYPIHNKSYNQWREKHKRGGDFTIYSKPKYMKLKKPIEFSLETLCRPSEKM